MPDRGQFTRIEVWSGRQLQLSAVIYPIGEQTACRTAKVWDSVDKGLAMVLGTVIDGLELKQSQRALLTAFMDDLDTDLQAFMEMDDDGDVLPF